MSARAPKVHTFDSTGDAYDASQCDDNIADGDVLSVPAEGVVGILCKAWPVAITKAHGHFHFVVGVDKGRIEKVTAADLASSFDGRDYAASLALAEATAAMLGAPAAREPELPKVGDRVRLRVACGDYPLTPVPAGSLGTVTAVEDNDYVGITLDLINPELAEWNNELHVYRHADDDLSLAAIFAERAEVLP